METAINGLHSPPAGQFHGWNGSRITPLDRLALNGHARDPEALRRIAWEIGEQRSADAFAPAASHVGLAAVTPYQGFAHWWILPEWVEQTACSRGDAWHHCRLVLRLYDVSFIEFTGLNAHRLQDETLPGLCGQCFFKVPRPGTWQLAEVGFLLRSSEFLPAARSQVAAFPPDAGSTRANHAALFVDERWRVQEVGNIWDQQGILQELRQPRLRQPLRIASFAWASLASGQDGSLARLVTELAAGQAGQGHEAHVFVPTSGQLAEPRQVGGVHYHPVEVPHDGTPPELARAFAHAAAKRFRQLLPFDLAHLHEWMAGPVQASLTCPTILSLTSIEATRRNGAPASELSQQIERAERGLARAADCVLTSDWLRLRAVAGLGLDAGRVCAFPLEGRLPNEWDCPLDHGQVKMGIGFGPLDRLLLFVGPLEHATGVDLLVEALPVLLQRWPGLRLAFAGAGQMHGHLEHRSHQLGVAHAVRLLGHVAAPPLAGLLRSAEALVLPSRCRVLLDDAVVDLARRAGRPVVTTHGGPAHLVRHEETGILTYDNPGSMVWAADRILGDPGHAQRMGQAGKRSDGTAPSWSEVARHYLELCAARFPELTQTRW
jgi:glycosyltransferase involved in cell wall biosynthesis